MQVSVRSRLRRSSRASRTMAKPRFVHVLIDVSRASVISHPQLLAVRKRCCRTLHSAIGVPRKRCSRRSLGREIPAFSTSPRQMVSGLWSGFRHLRHKPDVNAKPYAGGLFRVVCVNETRLARSCSNPALLVTATFGLTRSRPMSPLLLHASRRTYSNPQPSKLFRNASPNATFPPTGHSREGVQRPMRALA